MTTPMNYTPQQHAYLQAWRQILEPMVTLPFPMMPAMSYPTATPAAGLPGIPPMPHPPQDYAQSLFGYLQAWRQYLEEMIGAPVAPPPPAVSGPDHDQQAQRPYEQSYFPWFPPGPLADSPPGADEERRRAGGTATDGASDEGEGDSTGVNRFGKKVEANNAIPPGNDVGNQLSGTFHGLARQRGVAGPTGAGRTGIPVTNSRIGRRPVANGTQFSEPLQADRFRRTESGAGQVPAAPAAQKPSGTQLSAKIPMFKGLVERAGLQEIRDIR